MLDMFVQELHGSLRNNKVKIMFPGCFEYYLLRFDELKVPDGLCCFMS